MTVQTVKTIGEFRGILDDRRRSNQQVGLVPTMGYLHDGHCSLMERARNECDFVAVTIFVNPLQFAANEDLSSYPRDLPRDIGLCDAAGVDLILIPSIDEMYPDAMLTTVAVGELGATLEGGARPTHFAGVSTVVAKLFNISGPCRAYFGDKDYQQLAIVSRMVRDLSFPVTIVPCPIVREADGLAMSSRNVYLTPAERSAAPVLHRGLIAAAAAIDAGERDPSIVVGIVETLVRSEPLADLDYVEVVVDGTVTRPAHLDGVVRLLVAARFGRPRLLDNLAVIVCG